MKKLALVILAAMCLGILAAPILAAEDHNDFKVIQRAVKRNPAYEPGRDVRYLKILITDLRHREERISIALPLSLIELILGCTDSRHFKVDGGDCEIDLKALYADLKKAGPSCLIELRGEDGLLKVWLE
jgi:hypothetical protein